MISLIFVCRDYVCILNTMFVDGDWSIPNKLPVFIFKYTTVPKVNFIICLIKLIFNTDICIARIAKY